MLLTSIKTPCFCRVRLNRSVSLAAGVNFGISRFKTLFSFCETRARRLTRLCLTIAIECGTLVIDVLACAVEIITRTVLARMAVLVILGCIVNRKFRGLDRILFIGGVLIFATVICIRLLAVRAMSIKVTLLEGFVRRKLDFLGSVSIVPGTLITSVPFMARKSGVVRAVFFALNSILIFVVVGMTRILATRIFVAVRSRGRVLGVDRVLTSDFRFVLQFDLRFCLDIDLGSALVTILGAAPRVRTVRVRSGSIFVFTLLVRVISYFNCIDCLPTVDFFIW